MNDIMVGKILFKTDCCNIEHLNQVMSAITSNLQKLRLTSLSEIRCVIYRQHKAINILLK